MTQHSAITPVTQWPSDLDERDPRSDDLHREIPHTTIFDDVPTAPPTSGRASPGEHMQPRDGESGHAAAHFGSAVDLRALLPSGAERGLSRITANAAKGFALLVAVVALGVGVWWFTPTRGVVATVEPVATGVEPQPATAASPTPETPTPAATPVVVHVAGTVATPGLVTLTHGARVADAVDAAGGGTPAADLGALNLARVVADGERLYVPRPGEQPPPPPAPNAPTPAAGGGASGGRVNVNTATAEALDALPGVGPVIAQRIVDFRDENGPFSAVDDLTAVPGIGPASLKRLRDRVTT